MILFEIGYDGNSYKNHHLRVAEKTKHKEIALYVQNHDSMIYLYLQVRANTISLKLVMCLLMKCTLSIKIPSAFLFPC